MGRLKLLYDLPPRQSVRLLKRKLLPGSGAPGLDEIADSPSLMRAQRMYDFLSRYEAILVRSIGWTPLDFTGARVLEVGCGPLLGFAPLAIFRGAESCAVAEPDFVPGVLEHQRIVKSYFKSMHNDLSAIYGPAMDFTDFMAALRERVEVRKAKILDMKEEGGKFDIVLSNSCLEHVSPLKESMRALAGICAPDLRFLHLVDFGNHRSKADPFGDIYAATPDDYFKSRGRGINLTRPPDVLKALREAGFDAVMTPYVSAPELVPDKPAPYWTERYAKEDLALRVALFSSPGLR